MPQKFMAGQMGATGATGATGPTGPSGIAGATGPSGSGGSSGFYAVTGTAQNFPNTTLTNISGFSTAVVAGGLYYLELILHLAGSNSNFRAYIAGPSGYDGQIACIAQHPANATIDSLQLRSYYPGDFMQASVFVSRATPLWCTGIIRTPNAGTLTVQGALISGTTAVSLGANSSIRLTKLN